MTPLSDMWKPQDIKERMEEIDRNRGDLSVRFAKMKPGDTIVEPELIRDPQLARYYEAWQKLNQINQEIADGIRDENGEVNVRV